MKRTVAGNQLEEPSTAVKKPRFIDDITIHPSSSVTSSISKRPVYKQRVLSVPEVSAISAIEQCNELQFKYSILMNIPVETVYNEKLLEFLDEWYGAPYQYGGNDKEGVDCSAFTVYFMTSVYGITIPRNSLAQYKICEKIDRDDMEEGDLVFFNTRGRVSHVGVYLGNNKFAHASTSSGVMISDLDEQYFSKRFVGPGRIR